MQKAGFDVYQVDHEDANGQFEINFTYSDCLTTADRMVFFRMAAGEIGREMDVRYRETAGGGLAATPTGRRLAKERLYQIKRSDG